MRGYLCALFVVLAGAASAGRAADNDDTLVIETYGDSVTAGFLTNTNVTSPPPFRGDGEKIGMNDILSDLAMFKLRGDKTRLKRHHSPKEAWPQVLADRMAKSVGKIEVINRAVSGEFVHDLSRQVKSLAPHKRKTIAFFFIGHNDMCNNGDTPENIAAHFTREYGKALDEWDAVHDGAIAYLVPIADVHKVYKTLAGFTWFNSGEGKYTCEDSWEKLFPYCVPNSRRVRAKTFEEYFVPRQEAANKSIEKLAVAHTDKSKKNKFRFVEGGYDKPFEPKHFAVDCYHLSAEGQKAVAEELQARLKL